MFEIAIDQGRVSFGPVLVRRAIVGLRSISSGAGRGTGNGNVIQEIDNSNSNSNSNTALSRLAATNATFFSSLSVPSLPRPRLPHPAPLPALLGDPDLAPLTSPPPLTCALRRHPQRPGARVGHYPGRGSGVGIRVVRDGGFAQVRCRGCWGSRRRIPGGECEGVGV